MAYRILVAGLVFFMFPSLASAWSRPGHMVTAAVAYEAMKEATPEALGATLTLLRQHPHYPTLFRPEIERFDLSAEEQDIYLFMLASRWADDIRDKEEFDRAEWHYINIPYKPEGQPESVVVLPPPEPNIVMALEENRNIASGLDTTRDPAVALTWLFHLVGDVHQPLHTTRLFTTAWPDGDRGGTRFYVLDQPLGAVVSLHTLWDNLIIGTDRFADVRDKANELRSTYPRPEAAPPESGYEPEDESEGDGGDFEAWAQEGHEVAKEVAYLRGELQGGTTEATAVLLPADYASASGAVAAERAAVAGYRLAEFLAELLAGTE